jgi:catechol 2,3-dioxygenase-like lactoylglutathione lyase family enzyme
MRIKLNSIMVDDQAKALRFYTEVLGFRKKSDFPVGEYRWITVVSPEGPDDLELALEPNANPAGKTFQEALFAQGIAATAFEVSDLTAEFQRLRARGVAFKQEPTNVGAVSIAVFADTWQSDSAVPAELTCTDLPRAAVAGQRRHRAPPGLAQTTKTSCPTTARGRLSPHRQPSAGWLSWSDHRRRPPPPHRRPRWPPQDTRRRFHSRRLPSGLAPQSHRSTDVNVPRATIDLMLMRASR